MERVKKISVRKNSPIKRSFIKTRCCFRLYLIQLIVLSLVLSFTSSAQSRILIPIDILGSTNTFATGINNAGQIVGLYSDASYTYHGFLLSGGVYTTFNLPGTSAYIRGINNQGQSVGGYAVGYETDHGFLRSANGSFSYFNDPSATFGTYPEGINDAGQIVGQYYPAGPACFLLTGGSFTNFAPPGVNNPEFIGINNAGVILGDSRAGYSYTTLFLFSGGIYSSFTIPGAITASARGLNNLNQIVGFFSDKNYKEYGFLYSGGGNFSTIDDPFAVPGTSLFEPDAINDLGEIVGSYNPGWFNTFNTPYQGFVLSPVDLLDPVPGLINDLNTNPLTQQNYINLGSASGPIVQGVAADGVAEMLIRIPTRNQGDQFTLTLLNDQGQTSTPADLDNDGGLFPIGGTCCQPSVTASAVTTGTNTSFPAYAYALYRAPKDFVRSNTTYATTDTAQSSRNVYIQIERGGAAIGKETVKIVRPPVALIHGIWGKLDSWAYFKPFLENTLNPPLNSPHFYVKEVDYEATNYLGFEYNAKEVLPQIRTEIIEPFKQKFNVAAVQADVVAHSMGGDITRYFYLLNKMPTFLREQNYHQGDVHKLITLDTPHNGTPLAARLYNSSYFCQLIWWKKNHRISDGVRDLMPDSDALKWIGSVSSSPVHPQVYLIAGTANSNQASTVEFNYRFGSGDLAWLRDACADLLNDNSGNFIGFNSVMGPSDLLVPEASELAQSPALSIDGSPLPTTGVNGFIHSTDTLLFTTGPDILNRDYYPATGGIIPSNGYIPGLVIGLLNEPVYLRQYYGPITP